MNTSSSFPPAMKPHFKRKLRRLLLVLVVLGMAFSLYSHFKPEAQPLVGDVHVHADFKVYLNGSAYDIAQEKYMSEENSPLSPFTHLHDMDGGIIHKHMSGITLGDFFESLGMELTDTCFILDDGSSYCQNDTTTLSMYVNGRMTKKFDQYEISDLDRILITYGEASEEELQAQLSSVGDRACIYSETCPERGSPPDESTCTGSEDLCSAPAPHTHLEE